MIAEVKVEGHVLPQSGHEVYFIEPLRNVCRKLYLE